MRRSLIAAVLAFPAAAQAGIPTPEQVTCPVGGESFEITGTLSCTTFAPLMLSLAPQTSCDFVTRLPICPSNGLPVWREFTPEEISTLEAVVGSPDYDTVRTGHSAWYLAWWLENRLGGTDHDARFYLLIRGLWWDADKVKADPAHLDAAIAEQEALRQGPPSDDLPVLLGLEAYLHVLKDDFDTAAARLREARAALPEGVEGGFADTYLTLVGACIDTRDASSEDCQSHRQVR